MQYRKLLIVMVAAVAALFIFAMPAKAVDGSTSISISPLTFDLAANPGDTVTNELIVRNSGTDPVTIAVETQDFVATGEEGEVTLTDDKSTYSLASWVQVDMGQFTLEGGKQQRVKFEIRIPYNAEPGGHYASVYEHISPTIGNATTGSGVGQKIGSLLLLKVAGVTNETANVETFKTTQNIFEHGPVDFNIRIKDTGSVHIKPKGIIAITDIFGKKVADVTVDQRNVLPGAIRHMTATWTDVPMFGKYTATLLTYYGIDNKQLSAATTFWIIPWKVLLVWGGVIILAAVVIWLLRDRIKSAIQAFLKHK